MTPDAGAAVLSALEPYAEMLARDARAQGRKERREALFADALVAVAEHTRACESSRETAGPAPAVRVLVDHDVLDRGEVAQGGICEIQGIGPIPAATAAGMLADSNLAALVVDGLDIKGVSHLGRTVNARLRTALQARDPHCVVPGCYVDHHMEIDHVTPMKVGGLTKLENLARLCKWHHDQKTHHGYRLSGSPGKWRWEPPPGRAPTGPAQYALNA